MVFLLANATLGIWHYDSQQAAVFLRRIKKKKWEQNFV